MNKPPEKPPERPSQQQHPTARLPEMTDRAILEDLSRQARQTSGAVDRLHLTVNSLVHSHEVTAGQVGSINDRVGVIESKLYRIENPTVPPPNPITSDRVRAEIEAHPSQMDLETQAKVAEAIIKQNALEIAIIETRQIAERTATAIKKQSDVMGIGKKGIEWLRSKEARNDIQRIVMLISVVYLAFKQLGIIK